MNQGVRIGRASVKSNKAAMAIMPARSLIDEGGFRVWITSAFQQHPRNFMRACNCDFDVHACLMLGAIALIFAFARKPKKMCCGKDGYDSHWRDVGWRP